MRLVITFLSLTVILILVGYLFYSQEIKYWLPTPIPTNYENVEMGTTIDAILFEKGKKKFIHFYNPNCPCSKFNLVTYKELLNEYGSDFECYAVVQETLSGVPKSDKEYLEKLNVTLITDSDKQLAKKMGVYATPQIVLLDDQNKLYYRGNYNQARYCTNVATSFARIALDSLLNDEKYFFPVTAFTAYGCVLERKTN